MRCIKACICTGKNVCVKNLEVLMKYNLNMSKHDALTIKIYVLLNCVNRIIVF